MWAGYIAAVQNYCKNHKNRQNDKNRNWCLPSECMLHHIASNQVLPL